MSETAEAVCETCPRHCRLNEGAVGFCRARRAEDGRVVADNYGRITSMALDPIEKKPLAFFHPGSNILSVGSYGCNLRCPFCQNDAISQHGERESDYRMATPIELADLALRLRDGRGDIGQRRAAARILHFHGAAGLFVHPVQILPLVGTAGRIS